MNALETYDDWYDWATADLEWSQRRRSRARAERRLDRLFLLPAVLGLTLIIAYVSKLNPGEYWYLGLLAVVLMVPYLTRRLS